MDNQTTPGPVKARESLSKLGGTDNTPNPQKINKRIGFNHLKVLSDISEKWVRMGYYNEPGRALRALIGGEL